MTRDAARTSALRAADAELQAAQMMGPNHPDWPAAVRAAIQFLESALSADGGQAADRHQLATELDQLIPVGGAL
jgi:hypothetical protein